jgi:hypothetical protein
MSQTVTPNWTDHTSVISAQTLARGSTLRGTLNLKTKFGAKLFVRLGRGGTTALTNGVNVQIRALANDGTNNVPHPGEVVPLLSSTAAASSTTVSSDSASGQAALNVSSSTGFAAGDTICIQDSGGGVTRLEFAKVSKTATGVLTLDSNLIFTHTAAQADTVRNKADIFAPVWLDGGSLYEVIVDYGDDTAGEAVTVQVYAQTYDSDTIA